MPVPFRRAAARFIAIFGSILCLVVALAGFPAACGPPVETADLVLLNGRVWTGNPAQPWVEALAIRGNTIAAVGSTADIERRAGRETRRIDAGGRLVVPGLNDAHLHFLEGSLAMGRVFLDDAADLPEMQRRVKTWADAHPQAPWVLGRGWIYTRFPGGKFPSRRDLDTVVADRPVLLEAYDGHTTWVNSRALKMAGIDRRTVFKGFGEIVRDPRTGEPTGILKEAADSLVRKIIPPPTEEENRAALERGLAEARRYGITSVMNATGDPEDFALYDKVSRDGKLTVRVGIALTVEHGTTDSDVARFRELAQQHQDPLVRGGFVKMFADGVIESHTAAMLDPYSDDPKTSGKPNYTAEELDGWVKKLDAAGLNILIHAIGDRGVRMTLDAYEGARRDNPARERRHRIEHIEEVSEQDIPRFQALGVIPSMQPLHGAPDPDGVWAHNVGPGRLGRAFAWKSIRETGTRMLHGSDWPVVTLNPFHGIYTAVTRGYLDGRPEPRWHPELCVGLDQALAGYTTDPAYATFEDGQKGSLEPGKWADLAVLSNDLFKVPAAEIPKTESLLTIFDGKVVYEAGPLAPAGGSPSGGR